MHTPSLGFHEKARLRGEEDGAVPSFHLLQPGDSTPSTTPASPSPSLGDDYIDLESDLDGDWLGHETGC